ncbi:MAG: hypothetical protein NC453_26035 [Muribaculum sp.]|nr:hypothetical protein [Muribaculum sp.]
MTQNEVKLGNSKIEVLCHGGIPKDLSAIVSVSSIFDRTFNSEDIVLEREGFKKFFGDIETETPQTIGILMLFDDTERYAIGYVGLKQDDVLKIEVTFQDGKIVKIKKSNNNGVNATPFITSDKDEDTMLSSAAYIIASPGSWALPGRPTINSEHFSDTKTATEKLDSMRHYIMACALDARVIPPSLGKWFEFHLNNMVYGDYYLDYRNNSHIKGTLPKEFFRFLNNIDYSQLLTHNPITGPNYLMRKMLSSPDLGLSPIGETPVADWQGTARDSIGRFVDDVPQLLLDLLSATSYVEQINDNKPLTQKQIDNINSGYKDDLGKLVLKKNNSLVEALNMDVNKSDLSNENFILKDYIDKNYSGQPVVVDTWNTWCMPCMEAHKKLKPLLELEQSQGVAFLYVSDVTSPEEEWIVNVPKIGGFHVRINEASRDLMGTTYKLEAFPSYLFFDRDHNLRHTVTAYPGDKTFLKYIEEINAKR